MTWLIALYPPAWRRRYGRELRELIATQPASWSTSIDLVAGAIDAWLNPQSSTVAAANAKGAEAMVPKMLQLRCAGHGPAVTAADHRKAVVVTIVGTLALVLPMMWVTVLHPENRYLFSLMSTISWLLPYLYSQRYTTLKGRPGRVQAVLIGGPAAVVVAIALAAGGISSWIHWINR